jgi:hypothetical protein
MPGTREGILRGHETKRRKRAGMTLKEVAAALGVSKPTVQAIELRAINKLRVAKGMEPKPIPDNLRCFFPIGGHKNRCSLCHELGHNKQNCSLPPLAAE